jgi:hypothetical protein
MSIQDKLKELILSVNRYNENPAIGIPTDYQEKVDYVKDLLIDGYAISKINKERIKQQINDFKKDHPIFYNDALLNDYNFIYKSIKQLLSINNTDPIITTDNNIIYDKFLHINTDLGAIDGTPYPMGGCVWRPADPTCKGNLIDGTEVTVISVSMNNSTFNVNEILQILFISHELSHLILVRFIDTYIPELDNVNNILFGMLSKAIELYCDIIAVALVFITVRREEEVNQLTGMTPNEKRLNDNMTVASLSVGWGGEDQVHPDPNVRHSYSQSTFTNLRQIVDFDVNNPAKIKEVREIIKVQMRRFWSQCYGIDTTNTDRLGGLSKFRKVENLPAYRCASGALP